MSVQAARTREPAPPIPLTLITGFLGAGKTTLLNRLVKDAALADTALIINEFGEIGIDHLLVKSIADGIVLLQSGCLCCTLRGDLVQALEALLRDLDNGRIAFRRVMLETTGLADPAPVLQTAMAHPYLVMRFRLDGVVTLVDAVNGDATLDAHEEAVKQVAFADRLVLTKTDLLDPAERFAAKQALTARLRALNPAAPILDASTGEAVAAVLLNAGLYDPERKTADVRRWLAHEAYLSAEQAGNHGDHHHHHHHHRHHHDPNRHDARVRAFALTSDQALPAATIDMFLDLLRSLHGPNLLRVKGVIRLAESPDTPLVIHGVQHVFHPPARLDAWPDEDRRTRLVFIVRDLDPEVIRGLFRAFLGTPAIDRPDRAALVDNPLVPFGGVDR
ncbi:MAG: GTP-binding protein [Rhizobiales bacterium]|nr:GTP-binding protein [Hyphomicrobiales bacterium]